MALCAVKLAGLVCLVAVSAGHNAVLTLTMRVELAIGRGGGQVVDGVDIVMTAALQAEDGRMRKRPRGIVKAVLGVGDVAARPPAANAKKAMRVVPHRLLAESLLRACVPKVACLNAGAHPLVTRAG